MIVFIFEKFENLNLPPPSNRTCFDQTLNDRRTQYHLNMKNMGLCLDRACLFPFFSALLIRLVINLTQPYSNQFGFNAEVIFASNNNQQEKSTRDFIKSHFFNHKQFHIIKGVSKKLTKNQTFCKIKLFVELNYMAVKQTSFNVWSIGQLLSSLNVVFPCIHVKEQCR